MEIPDERDWITVANDLLSKCHINRRVTKLCECDASVFVALYEAILGEKVPDYIATPKSQEDDAHNVQAVIDSLALDYLQISLSHITGENIIQNNKESIRNLLEIFDGLLEYLTEQISEASSQHGDPDLLSSEAISVIRGVLQEELGVSHEEKLPGTGDHLSKDSSSSVPTWDGDGSESTNELIRLGESACTYSHRMSTDLPEFRWSTGQQSEKQLKMGTQEQNGICSFPASSVIPHDTNQEEILKSGRSPDILPVGTHAIGPSTNALQLGEPIRPAIPLQSPYHPAKYKCPIQGVNLINSQPSSHSVNNFMVSQEVHLDSQRKSPTLAEGPKVEPASKGCNVPERSEKCSTNKSLPSLPLGSLKEDALQELQAAGHVSERNQELQSTAGTTVANSISVQKRVAFQTEPDIRMLTMQSKTDQWDKLLEEGVTNQWEDLATRDSSQNDIEKELSSLPINHKDQSDLSVSFRDEPLSRRRARNILAEEELHEMSEKLSQKLRQLDLMLKRALSDKCEVHDFKEEDKLSQHSDSITEYRRIHRLPATPLLKKPARARARSLSPSPPRQTLQAEFEDALNKDSKGEMRRIRRELQQEMDLQRMKAKVVNECYREELENYKKKEKAKIGREKTKVKKTEKEYKENIFKEAPRTPQPARVYSAKTTPRKPKHGQWTLTGLTKPKKATPMKIHDNDLLPLLLDEFPYLSVSPHTMNRMWKQQFKQIEQLTKSSSEQDRNQAKLQSAIEDAQRKHDLLMDIIKKEQDHNQRLKEFKERIRQQKLAQNKIKEQRQQIARAKKYYNDYHVQLRAKMMRARTREERIFKNLFEGGLQIQKQRLRELKAYAKEKRQEHKKRQKEELQSMENYYRDQFLMLAETLAQEQQKVHLRETAQNKALQKLKNELRAKMEKEIRELQEMITRDDDDVYFRELEAERVQRQLQMALFQYSKTPSS
ncbi:centrosomal protein of 95 kDa-like isoform X2 [Pristis pectinata]|uniref:centrosomal protein of 95 kDa-like isoform X2 n=1 Tax=Pristis pectinata TaxID=685728 RepID=UPI00223CD34D|nr:centrosomal protein of 95 kDa-like isoform X2 [Pristis pectinata]